MEDETFAAATPDDSRPRPPRRGGGASSVRTHDTLAVIPIDPLTEQRRRAYGPFYTRAEANAFAGGLPGSRGDWLVVPLQRQP